MGSATNPKGMTMKAARFAPMIVDGFKDLNDMDSTHTVQGVVVDFGDTDMVSYTATFTRKVDAVHGMHQAVSRFYKVVLVVLDANGVIVDSADTTTDPGYAPWYFDDDMLDAA